MFVESHCSAVKCVSSYLLFIMQILFARFRSVDWILIKITSVFFLDYHL